MIVTTIIFILNIQVKISRELFSPITFTLTYTT